MCAACLVDLIEFCGGAEVDDWSMRAERIAGANQSLSIKTLRMGMKNGFTRGLIID